MMSIAPTMSQKQDYIVTYSRITLDPFTLEINVKINFEIYVN